MSFVCCFSTSAVDFQNTSERSLFQVTPNIKYEDLGVADDTVNQIGMTFRWVSLKLQLLLKSPNPLCLRSKLIINDKDEFIGSGKSKKAAKNDAAMLALKKIFMVWWRLRYRCALNLLLSHWDSGCSLQFDYNNPEQCQAIEAAVKQRRRSANGCSQLCFDVSFLLY